MGLTVSSAYFVSAAPFSSGGGLLTLFTSSSVRSLPWETVLHKLLQHESCPSSRTAPACILPTVCSPSGKGCSSTGPLQGHNLCQETCASVGSSLHESTGPARCLLQRGLPTGSQRPWDIHLLWCGVPSTGYGWMSTPLWTSMGCRGTACLAMVFIIGCKGKLSSPESQAPPPPPSSLPLVSAKLFLSHSLTPLSRLPFHHSFFPILKYVITEALPPSPVGLVVASGGSILETAGTGFIRYGGSFSQLLTEPTPIAPPLRKPCHANP